jgi:hypothetical protein
MIGTAPPRVEATTLDGAAAGFGIAAGVAILFNTALACLEDAFDALSDGMAALTGHHWITHGLATLLVFVAVGLMSSRRGRIVRGFALARAVAGAAILGSAGLALWFVFV